MKEAYAISVVIPCRNEAEFISQCIDSIIENDFPKEMMEIIVVDGISDDNTREIVRCYEKAHPFIRLVDNPMEVTPNALNIGIEESKGDFIVVMGAHATYSKDYLSKCLKYAIEYEADIVGGKCLILPRDASLMGKAIALCTAHPFGSGNALYKTGYSGEPTWVDTVAFGCYKKEIFDKVGLFDEHLARGQDMEFSNRLKAAGGCILLVPEITSKYYVRSNLKEFFIHNLKDGAWVVNSYRFTKEPVSIRHLVPLLFVASGITLMLFSIFHKMFRVPLILITTLYSACNLYFSTNIAREENEMSLIPFCFLAFFVRHIGYGLGSLGALPRTLMTPGFWLNSVSTEKGKII